MGKSPKKKDKGAAATSTDDELLDAAIAENARVKAEAAATAAAAAAAKQETSSASLSPAAERPEPEKKALDPQTIMAKLNTVPSFCVLNGDSNIVAMMNADGEGESCTWFTDPDDARHMLATAKEQNPDVADELHLGVTPLGIAYAMAVGWVESLFVGDLRLQGKVSVVSDMSEALHGQVVEQGLAPTSWVMPTFAADELSNKRVQPIFFSRADLVAAWVASGRPRESVPTNLAVIELRVLVTQMQTDAYAWSTLEFVGSTRAADLVREAKVAAAVLERRRALAAGAANSAEPPPIAPPLDGAAEGDEPPPLQGEDEPPPLE